MVWGNFLCWLDSEAAAGWQEGRANVIVLASIIPELPVLPGCVSLWDGRTASRERGLTLGMKGERQGSQQAVISDPTAVKTPSKTPKRRSLGDAAQR